MRFFKDDYKSNQFYLTNPVKIPYAKGVVFVL